MDNNSLNQFFNGGSDWSSTGMRRNNFWGVRNPGYVEPVVEDEEKPDAEPNV